MEYNISKIIAKKKIYIFRILVSIFILIAITTSVIGSFALYQFNSNRYNFTNNKFAKTIEISSFNEKTNETRKLTKFDIERIRNILKNTASENKVIVEYQINFGIQTGIGEIVFVKSFSDNFFIENTLTEKRFLLTKKNLQGEKLVLNIPIIKSNSGGFVSDTLEKKEYNLLKIDPTSVLNKYFNQDEIIASEEIFKEITTIMFPNEEYVDVEKIYINVDKITDIREIANILSSENYNTNHAFEYYWSYVKI